MKAKGVDVVACIAVNDPFVMDAFGKSTGADGKVHLLYILSVYVKLIK